MRCATAHFVCSTMIGGAATYSQVDGAATTAAHYKELLVGYLV